MKLRTTSRVILLTGCAFSSSLACGSGKTESGQTANRLATGGATGALGSGGASGGASGEQMGQAGAPDAIGGTKAGSGGRFSSGGATGAEEGSQSGGAASEVGTISINDPVPGWASQGGGTTGGGKDLSQAITVSTMSELQSAAKGSEPAIILVQPGTYTGALQPGANKTIIGTGPGVTIQGYIKMSGSEVSNLILRNLAVRGDKCASYDECKAGADGVYIGNNAHHIWLDHLDIADGQDGNCDITQGGDYVTVSWTHFHYTYDKEHRFSNLIAGSDDEPKSEGKLQITYMNCHWGERVDTRQPRGRYGKVHSFNNYHNTHGGTIHGVGKDMSFIAESCFYDEPDKSIFTDMGGGGMSWKGIGNEGNAKDMNASNGSVFVIPYSYTAIPASQVKDALMATNCGASNSCTFK